MTYVSINIYIYKAYRSCVIWVSSGDVCVICVCVSGHLSAVAAAADNPTATAAATATVTATAAATTNLFGKLYIHLYT